MHTSAKVGEKCHWQARSLAAHLHRCETLLTYPLLAWLACVLCTYPLALRVCNGCSSQMLDSTICTTCGPRVSRTSAPWPLRCCRCVLPHHERHGSRGSIDRDRLPGVDPFGRTS